MSRKYWLPPVLGLVLTLLMLLLVALSATAQEPVSQPTLDVYFIRLQPLPEGDADLASSFQSAYDRLKPTLLELSADGQLATYENLPAIRSVRVIASQDAMTRLASRPEVARIEPLHPRQAAPPATPVTSEPDGATAEPTAAEAPLSPDVPPAKPVSEQPVLPPDSIPTSLQGEIITYNWVNNQGANPPITYNWTEISNTGSVVAQGDDVFSQVQLGFPFTFYGTIYTDVFVSSNGFLSFGSGSSGFSNTSIPDPASPNNAVYAFWDDLNPSGGTNGNVFTKQISATRYVIEWYRVKCYSGNDLETFQIILDGADNTIMLQFQSVSGTGSSTVGVENSNGTVGTQVAYNTSSAIFGGLAIEFTPALTTVYTIAGTVRDSDTTPVSGARVEVTAGPTRPFTMSDASGRYSLIVIPGVYTLRAEKFGYFRTPERTATVPPDQVTVDLTFPQRYTISGKVLDWDGTPIVGAIVSTKYNDPVSASDQTDTTGAYELIVTSGTYHVSVYKSDLPSPPQQDVTVPPNQAVNFTFPFRYTISGKVLDWDGTPIVDAYVSTKGGDPVSASDRTDATGAYTLTVSAGTYHVSAYKSGLPSLPEQSATVPPSQVLNFTYPRRYTISGTVRDYDGTPLENAWVSTKSGDPASVGANTNATGMYTLTVIALGTYHVSVSKYPLPGPPEQTTTVPPSQVVNFTFPTRYTISGKALDWDGAPIAGAYVSTKWDDPVSTSAQTDTTGAYTLTVLAGTYHVSASKGNLPAPPALTVTMPPSQIANFTFPRRYTIRGTVRNYDNTPVKDASVSTNWDDPMHAYAQTDATGAYTLTVTSGAYTVGASKSGYPDPPDRQVTVPPNATGVDFAFPQPYPISGTVRDGAGKPVQGATVWGGLNSVTTAADGTYTAMAGPGDHYVSAQKDGYQSAPSVIVPVPPAASGVDFVLLVKDQTIRGRVVDNQGRPLVDAYVSASSIVCGNWGSGSTRAAANGAYTLTVPSGTYHVTASKDGYVPAPPELAKIPAADVEAAASAEVNFTLEPLAYTIRGTVRDSLGQPMEDAWVNASACGLSNGAETDATGAYTVTVSANTFSVSASKSGYVQSPVQIVAVPPNAEHVEFTLELQETHTITGRVTDSQGHPLEDAYVHTDGSGPDYDSDRTDAAGKYTLQVIAGTYRIFAEQEGYARVKREGITVPPDQTGVDFVLPPADLRIQGTVRDTAGRGVPNVRVCPTPSGESSSYLCRTTYYNGTYTKLLPAGTYRVSASGSCYTYASISNVTLPPSKTGLDFSIKLYDQLIAGRTTDSDGQPVCGASVNAKDGVSESDSTERNGRYALQMPSGTYTVSASKSGYSAPPSKSVTVPPLATAVNFVFQALNKSTVQGAVRDNHGASMAGVSISASGPNGSAATVTGPDGSYTLKVVDGSWSIAPSKSGYLAFPSTRPVVTPPNRTGVDFTLIARSEIKSVYLPLLLRSR